MGLSVAFFGTPAFAVPTLDALHRSTHRVAVVVTQPDRPRARGQRVTPSPVKAYAEAHGLPVLQPTRLRDDDVMGALAATGAEIGVVAAYGKILPQRLLDWPSRGLINVHASLLPRWRGAAPIHRAVIAGDAITGVTIMRVVAALDAGPMIDRVETPIGPDETSEALETRLATLGAELLVKTVDRLALGPVEETPQDDALATYASRVERRESQVDWMRPAAAIHNQIRGLQPWPLAAVLFHGRRVLLRQSQVAHTRAVDVEPGVVSRVEPDAIEIAARPGAVRILRLQIEGRPAVDTRAFLNGHPVRVGDRFDPLPDAR
ncbi:MAG TPA: methionyl-tRNA formyltransferase [Vicinamibacterales bacterium]|jgi:methionyl-tRNA formyltransferase|nr:methionyl-tRNA formyltransferase [Vicinamibacterales bacterium]